MRVLIRTRGPDGSWKESASDTSRVTIGRGTQNMVELPGLLVALEHATLAMAGDGVYRLDAKTAVGVEVDGASGVRQGLLKAGAELRIGGHVMTIEGARDRYELVLAVEPAPAGQEAVREAARLDLHDGGLRKRRPAIILSALFLLIAVVVPMVMTFAGTPASLRRFVPHDTLWVGGHVSSGHSHFEHDCSQCHGSPFRNVGNGACLKCHETVGHHSDDPAILKVKGFDGVACVSCHKEHRGPDSLVSLHPAQCTSCHADPKALGPWSKMPAVTDFRDDHPPFRYTVNKLSDDGTRIEAMRAPVVVQGVPVKDVSGLAFPHDVHLVKEGVKSPDGRERLVCGSCHTPDAAKAGFRDLDFEKHCQRCHKLELVTPERTLSLPHGQNDASRFMLEAFYVPAAQAAHVDPGQAAVAGRQRIGAENAATHAPADRAQVVAEVFEYQLCGKCHIVDTSGEHPRVIPPQPRHTWMPSAFFSHSPHDAVPCEKCHAVATSKGGDDLNLPAIETCRSCHAGTHDSEGVRSTCVTCHTMHRSPKLLMSGQVASAGGLMGMPGAPPVPSAPGSAPVPSNASGGSDNAAAPSAPLPPGTAP